MNSTPGFSAYVDIPYELDSFFGPKELGAMKEQLCRVAPQDTTILLTGETGTGKTRLARLIHQLSPRRNEPLIIVDCSALSPSIIESEMFGHVKGAFTGADRNRDGKFFAAGQGTLVLDEINSLSLHLQVKLLRIVEDRVFEPVGSNQSLPLQARIITISNAPLEQEIAAGRFRADLYYRLNVVGFYLPPLEERRAAIAPLATRFFREISSRIRPELTGFSSEALAAMEMYEWPGNIRELRNVVERTVSLSDGPVIQFHDLPQPLQACVRDDDPSMMEDILVSDTMTLSASKEKAEVLRIKEALQRNNNNKLRAAHELGISRMGLYKKLQKYGLASGGGSIKTA